MLHHSRPRQFAARCAALTLALLVHSVPAALADPPQPRVEGTVPSGILYDLAAPLARAERFDGTPGAGTADASTLRQVVHEFSRASLAAATWPAARVLRDDGSMAVRIALVDVRYDRLRDDADETGLARVEGDRLVLSAGALETRRAFLAAPVRGYSYRGAAVTFVLDPAAFAGNAGAKRPARVEADFGTGSGYRALPWNEPVTVRYPAAGSYTARVRATDADGVVQHAAFAFEVRALVTPSPNDTIPLTGTQPYSGGTATGRAFVYLAPGHPQIARPAVVVEGFDLDNTMNWDELYALLNQEGLIEELRTRGYDAVVLDFTDATEYIQRNAFVLVDLIHQVETILAPENDYPLVGASMGGLVARYALAWMETNADPHRVRNFVSFDVPHAGANIPLGIQYWLDFFSDQSAEAANLLSRLDTPAARQMLLYHYTAPPGSTGQADPLRPAFETDLAALGDYPAQPRLVALSNGSGTGQTQGFNAGAQIIQYEYNTLLVNVRGNVWAVPAGGPLKIFDGLLRVFFVGPSLIVNVSGTLPWDGAPGGSRNSMAQMDSVTAPYGDIVALHQRHCFIPSVSALDIATTNPFYDIAGDPDLLSHTPFANLYVPAANEPHITVTPDNAVWLLDEIDPPAVAVRDRTVAPAFSMLTAAPNPFGEATSVRWQLTRSERVRVDVYDVRGARVATLLDATRPAGAGEVRWSGRDHRGHAVSAGVYFVRVAAAGETRTRRVVLVR